jgi:hypothetical protein
MDDPDDDHQFGVSRRAGKRWSRFLI